MKIQAFRHSNEPHYSSLKVNGLKDNLRPSYSQLNNRSVNTNFGQNTSQYKGAISRKLFLFLFSFITLGTIGTLAAYIHHTNKMRIEDELKDMPDVPDNSHLIKRPSKDSIREK